MVISWQKYNMLHIVNCIIVWVSLLFMHYLVCLIFLVIIRGKGNIKVICQTNTMIVNWNDLHTTNWHFGPLVYAVTSGTRTNKWCMHYRTVTSIGCHPPVSHHHPPPSPIPSQVRIVFCCSDLDECCRFVLTADRTLAVGPSEEQALQLSCLLFNLI